MWVVWKSVLLELVRFGFDICVVINSGEMTGLPLWDVEEKFMDHECDFRGDTDEVSRRVYGWKLVPAVVGGDVVKVVC